VHEHLEAGERRRLDAVEIATVLSVFDHFHLAHSLTRLGVAEFENLRQRLACCIIREDLLGGNDGTEVRNACFDALACIRALEGRLMGSLATARARGLLPSAPANDT
jgi:hypothetical protein